MPLIGALLTATLVATAGPSPSPSPSPTPPASIGNVTVVTGSPESLHKAPQATSVVSASALQASTATSLDAALRTLPGFDRSRGDAPFTNYGQLRLSFEGAGQDRGALFVDGIPAQDGFGGQVDWNLYAPLSIARGELLRGPGSALYGSGAIGGVLSLTTTQPSLQDGGVVEGSYGGEDHGTAVMSSTQAFGSWASAITLSSTRLSFGVVPTNLEESIDRPGVSTADTAHVRLLHSDPGNSLAFDAIVGTDAQQDGQPNDGFSRSLDQLAATWTTGTIQTFALTAFARETKLTNLADNTTTHPGALLYTQYVPTSDAGVRARWDDPVPGGAYSLIAERHLVSGWNDQVSGAGVTQSNIAGTQGLDGFALQRTFEGRFGAVLGARYDAVHTDALGPRDANAISPRLDTKYDLSPATTMRAAYGTGLRAPFLNELIRSYRIGTTLYENNPDLAPERSRSAQVGFDVASPGSHLAVDYTGTIVHDALGFSTISPTVQMRSNFGETATNTFTGDYRRGGPCADVRLFGALNHDRVTQGTPIQIGKRLAYIPDEAAAVDVERTTGPVTAAVELSYSGPTFADSLQQQPIGTAFLVGERITYQFKSGTSLALGVDNLTDRYYLTSIDRAGPPSSVTLRLTVPWGARAAEAVRTAAACG
ncbi:MAG TPA: TonB-dependent receptor [Candidatus Sulfotelmatobacter sp.]|nr:TonB-dependent receptor [Candidatus Sulfotelmatobacter sp.]